MYIIMCILLCVYIYIIMLLCYKLQVPWEKMLLNHENHWK